MWLLLLACVTLLVEESIETHTFTELDLSNPAWKAQFAKNYEKGLINVSPDNIEIVRAVHDHNHMWLLGSIDVVMYTIRVSGGKPCMMISQYAPPPHVSDQGFVQDGCGIAVTSDAPVPERRDMMSTDDDMHYLDGFEVNERL